MRINQLEICSADLKTVFTKQQKFNRVIFGNNQLFIATIINFKQKQI